MDVTTNKPDQASEIFVSYVNSDNQAGEDGGPWIDSFIDLLKKCLRRIPGMGDACSIWTDQALAASSPLTPELVTRIENTPVFVIVLSRDYLQSEWCASLDGLESEIPAFLRLVDGYANDEGCRVFIVEKSEIDGQRPAEFSAAPVYRFWTRDDDEKSGTLRASLEEIEFVDSLNDLALDIARELRRLRRSDGKQKDVARPQPGNDRPVEDIDSHNGATTGVASPDQKVVVYLAHAARELNPLRKKVKRYYEQAGLQVVPAAPLQAGQKDVRSSVEKDLAGADLFVQLLGYAAADEWEDTSESLTRFQFRRGREMGLPSMQWRNSDLTAEDIEEDIEDRDHRNLLLDGSVQAVDIEDFNRDVVANAKPRVRQEEITENRDSLDAYIFINMQSPDRPGAAELCRYLEHRGIEYATISNKGKASEIRAHLTDTLLETDGMIVVYDQKDDEWVRPQLNAIRKILQLPQAKQKRSNPKLVYKSPPKEERPHHGIQLRNMKIIDCSTGFDAAQLDQFLDEVETIARNRFENERELVEKRDHYDVFLAHNSVDKPFVRELYIKLKEQVVHPWLDEKEIMPGSLFQTEIQNGILKCESAAILIGQHGLGAWQELELQSLISRCVKNDIKVIPVLLPGVDSVPDDFLFLQEHQWVKFEDASDRQAIESLICGIKA